MKRAQLQKQLRVAFFSSLAVSVLTTTPVFMMTRLSFSLYPWTLVFATGLTAVMWGLNILLFYLSEGSRWIRYAGSYIVCVGFAIGVFHGFVHGPEGSVLVGGARGFYFHIILFFSIDTVLLILQDLAVVRERKAEVELENAQLRMRNMEAANLQLQHQVQPHFLFNSLSTLKSLIRHSPADAEEYVVKLAGFLRSSIATHPSALSTVDDELSLCQDYLEMQRIRFGEALQFSIGVEGGGFLPVFAVQGLIENAIKHNVLTRERPLWIRVEGDGKRITVVNNLQVREEKEGMGMGLANLRERYRMLGGGEVIITKNQTEFSVSINVLSNANRDH